MADPPKRLAAAALVPLALLGALELLLRVAGVAPDPPGIDVARFTDGRRTVTIDAPGSTMKTEATFAEAKPQGAIRIAFLGASTTAGIPYAPRSSYASIVMRRLEALFPGRWFESINLGTPSIDTHWALNAFEALEGVDVVVVETGHNEFLPINQPKHSRRYALRHRLEGLRIFRLLARLPIGERIDEAGRIQKSLGAPLALPELLDDAALAARDEAIADVGAELERFARRASDAGVTAILVAPPSNWADFPPEASCATNAPAGFAQRLADLTAQVDALAGPDDALLAAIDRERQAQPRCALLEHLRATLLARAGKLDEAATGYARAYELAPLPVSAPPRLHQAIRDAAAKAGVRCADAATAFLAAAPWGIVSLPLVVDHCHPSLEGQYLLASIVLDAMRRSGRLCGSDKWPAERDPDLRILREEMQWFGDQRLADRGLAGLADLRFALNSFAVKLYARRAAARLDGAVDAMGDPALAAVSLSAMQYLAGLPQSRATLETALASEKARGFHALLLDSSPRLAGW